MTALPDTIEKYLSIPSVGGGDYHPTRLEIAYISSETGVYQVYVKSLETGAVIRISHGEDRSTNPVYLSANIDDRERFDVYRYTFPLSPGRQPQLVMRAQSGLFDPHWTGFAASPEMDLSQLSGDTQTAIAVLFSAQVVFGVAGAAFNPAPTASIPSASTNSLMQGSCPRANKLPRNRPL